MKAAGFIGKDFTNKGKKTVSKNGTWIAVFYFFPQPLILHWSKSIISPYTIHFVFSPVLCPDFYILTRNGSRSYICKFLFI